MLPVGAIGSALLHALLILPFLLGASAKKMRMPNSQGAGASASASNAEPMMTLIQINAPVTPPEMAAIPEEIASRGLTPETMAMKVLSPDSAPALDLRKLTTDQDAPDPTPEAAGDMAGHAMLFGRYVGQITARIERAWVRPRSGIAEPLFRCRVKIVQNKNSEVREVEMQQCNGDLRWQMSLAAAIQTASPLPAPPDPSVFANALTLSFDSEPFHAGGSEEGFEPEKVQVASTFSLGPRTAEIFNRPITPAMIQPRVTGTRDETLSVPHPGTRESEYPTIPASQSPESTTP